ncbi:MAG: lysoplasmalogenase, partial [Amphiplicatus sp.]
RRAVAGGISMVGEMGGGVKPVPQKTAVDNQAHFFLWTGAIAALSYLAAALIDPPLPLDPIWKASGIVLLALYAFLRRAPLAGAALAFSAVGDVMLALEPPQWTLGMAGFGIAHLFYGAAFFAFIRRDGFNRKGLPFALLVLAISVALGVWHFPGMGALQAPGLAYQAIITAMAMLALVSRAPVLAKCGALVFMLSDSLIALGLYKNIQAPPGSIWLTYAAAQVMLAKAFSDAARG